MDRFVMRHPEVGTGLVPESAVPSHEATGWARVSGPIPEHEMDQVDLSAYADAPDLDAEPRPDVPAPETDPAQTSEEQF